MSERNRILTTPIRWGKLCGFAAFFFVCLIIWLDARLEATHPGNTVFFVLFPVEAIGAFVSGVHYTIRGEGIIVRWANIPLRKISWDKVGHAEYIHIWEDISYVHKCFVRESVSGQIIYVTLKGCPRYHPKHEIRLFHNLLHPFRTACIWLPYATEYQYIEAFKEYYPNLEIQPVNTWKTM